jgi:hypothetical protein
MATTYESVDDLAEALRRAAEAHGKHEEPPTRTATTTSVIGGGPPGEYCADALAEANPACEIAPVRINVIVGVAPRRSARRGAQ